MICQTMDDSAADTCFFFFALHFVKPQLFNLTHLSLASVLYRKNKENGKIPRKDRDKE